VLIGHMTIDLSRRKFIVAVGGAASWPLAARAQQLERMLRVGVLMPYREDDLNAKGWLSEFTQSLQGLGWTDGRNVRLDVRWAASDDGLRIAAKDLVDLQPDVILVIGTSATTALHRLTQTIPIVFANVVDPVGPGFVASLPRPEGNITGFINIEAEMTGKWLQLLTEIDPSVKRVAIMFNPDTAPFVRSYFLPSFEAVARSIMVESIAAPVHSEAEIEEVITSLGVAARGGLVVSADGFMFNHRAAIISLTARSKVTTVYQFSVYVREGGLISYGPNFGDIYRRAAPYVDRILRGTKPADLPVQLPTKFEMALNTKTAKALGLPIPQSILLRADEVIE
jgi:putative tryptophan/tyrosine transport system substrate-binding protein